MDQFWIESLDKSNLFQQRARTEHFVCMCVCIVYFVVVILIIKIIWRLWPTEWIIIIINTTTCGSHIGHLILGLNVFDEIDDAVGVTVLVVVPRDELNEGVGQLDSGLSIEY